MSLPDGITTITLTGRYAAPDGKPLGGQVSFTPSSPLTDPDGQVVLAETPLATRLDSSGSFSIDLACTDNADLNPEGWQWRAIVQVPGAQASFYFDLPSTLGDTHDISALTPHPGAPAASGSYVSSINGQTGDVELGDGFGIVPPVGDIGGGTTSAPQVTSTHLSSPLPVAQGGTGAATGSAALAALGGISSVSPALTGTPTAPTATALTDSTQLATTAYADSAVAVEKSRAQTAEGAALQKTSNLSDVASPSTARTNLGLGSAATQASSAFDAAGAATAAQAASLQKSSNLSDLASAGTARTNLGLGTAATLASSAVAQTANNLSDLANAGTARTNLGLGTAATQATSAFDAAGAASTAQAASLQKSSNLADLASASAARTNLSLDSLYNQRPGTAENTYFVSAASYASDSNDGLSVRSAKATVGGALAALGSNAGLIQLGAGTFTIAAADGNGNGITLASALQRIRGLGPDITRISLTTTLTYGVVLLGALSSVEDMTISVPSGGNVTYGCGVTSATSAESCSFRRVLVAGVGGTLANGFAVSPDHHADVAFATFWECKASTCTGAGWILNDGVSSNVLDTRMFGCVSENNQYGVKANSCGFRWYGGDFGENTYSDIYLASLNESDPVVVDGPRSENSARMLYATAVSAPATVALRNYYFGVANDSFLSSDGAFINYGFSGNLSLDNVTFQNQGTITPLILLGANLASSDFTLTVSARGLQTPQPLHQLFSAAPTEAISVVAESYTQLAGTGATLTSGTYIPGPVRLGPGFKTFTWNGTGRDVMSPVEFQTLSSAGAVTVQGVAEYAEILLQANCSSSSVTNLYPGQRVTISWVQDSTGGRTYSWPSNCIFATGQPPAASTAANAVDSVTFFYDGTNLIELSSRPSSAPPSVSFVTATGSYTWTKPAGAQTVDLRLLGGGGGGGSGMRGAASGVRCGGGGGAGGVLITRTFAASDLPSSVTGSVGAGGAGGAAVTSDSASGSAGTGGTGSTFGSFAFAPGGNAGAGGTISSGSGGVSGTNGGNNGAGGSASTTGLTGGNSGSSFSASGGGAGGGISAANAASNGGTASFCWNGASSNTGSGGVVDTTAPGAGTQPASQGTPSCGGGGGAASVTTAAQAGATAFYGGGGGGGGASVNGSNSGAGGTGGPGWAMIVTHFA